MRSLVIYIFLHACESWTLTTEENEALPQDSTHLIERQRYQRGSPCHDPTCDRTTRRPSDHRKETQTAVVWSCLPFISSSGLADELHAILQGTVKGGRRQGRQKKRREDTTREWAGLEFAKSQRAVENRRKKMEKTGCEVIRGTPTSPTDKAYVKAKV